MVRDRRYSSARWRRLRAEVIRRDGRVCAVADCTSDMWQPRMTQVDHIIDVKDGGPFWDPDNLRVVCSFHHYAKTLETIGERRAGRVRRPDDQRFPSDGHLNENPTGWEWASPNGLGCDNASCSRCLAEGFRS